MIVLSVDRRLQIEDKESHINFPFHIPRTGRELRVNMSFHPARLEDKNEAKAVIREGFIKYLGEVNEDKIENYLPLRNLMTISIDSPIKSLGTAHRHLKDIGHFINKDKASRGFYTSEIMDGLWNITLSVFAIVTEYVDVVISAEVIYD